MNQYNILAWPIAGRWERFHLGVKHQGTMEAIARSVPWCFRRNYFFSTAHSFGRFRTWPGRSRWGRVPGRCGSN